MVGPALWLHSPKSPGLAHVGLEEEGVADLHSRGVRERLAHQLLKCGGALSIGWVPLGPPGVKRLKAALHSGVSSDSGSLFTGECVRGISFFCS